MIEFGKASTLKDGSSWLQDDRARIDRILKVTETDSVIEGLPPLQEETRERLRQRLASLNGRAAVPRE